MPIFDEDVHCPKCKSLNWRCVDERWEWYEDPDFVEVTPDSWQQYFQLPVGLIVCGDCGARFSSYDVSSEGMIHWGESLPWEERDA